MPQDRDVNKSVQVIGNNKKRKERNEEVDVLTVETGQGSSETAIQEAAAVDYGSAACGREDAPSTSEFASVSFIV